MSNLPVGLHRLEELLKFCLESAQQMLEAHGAFFPFGAVVDATGNRIPVTGDPGQPNPKTPDVYQLIARSMRAQFARGEIVAGAIAADVTIPPELKPTYPQGIRVAVESGSISRIVFLPYLIRENEAKSTTTAKPAAKVAYGEYLGLDVRPTILTGAG